MGKQSLLILLIFTTSLLCAQDFSTDAQYKQAMANAKTAFEAEQYSQAVLFYREALKIKPEELLPKYKIEDIRTIYIENQLDTLIVENTEVVPVKRESRKEKKERELEQVALEKKAEERATAQMNKEADIAKEELDDLKLQLETLEIDEGPIVADTLQIEEIIPDREVAVNNIEPKKEGLIQQERFTPNLTVNKVEVPDSVYHQSQEAFKEQEQVEKKEEPKPKVVNTKPVTIAKPKAEPKKEDLTKMTSAQRKVWIEQEQEKLKRAYPNKKTVEEIEKPNKHITRVIMHIDGHIDIYLKVKHSWGATFYFIDKTGQELQSINQQYFNLKTNLDSYGY